MASGCEVVDAWVGFVAVDETIRQDGINAESTSLVQVADHDSLR
jgi:hypothetical protein